MKYGAYSLLYSVLLGIEPCETSRLGIVPFKSQIFWGTIPGIGISIVGSKNSILVLVSVPFNIQD